MSGEDASSIVEHFQQAIIEPDMLSFFRLLNSLDVSFDTQTESSDEETVLSSFVSLKHFNAAHDDVLQALLARGFDPTYATSQYFNPSEELDGVPEHLHELLSKVPDGFEPSARLSLSCFLHRPKPRTDDRVKRWLAAPPDQLTAEFFLPPTVEVLSPAIEQLYGDLPEPSAMDLDEPGISHARRRPRADSVDRSAPGQRAMDDDEPEASGVRPSFIIQLNGPEVFTVPPGLIYKTEMCRRRGHAQGCGKYENCIYAHTERELDFYTNKRWQALASAAQWSGVLNKKLDQTEPKLLPLAKLSLSAEDEQLIIASIREPNATSPLMLDTRIGDTFTSVEDALAAFPDPVPAYPDDPALEQQYRAYLRMCIDKSDDSYNTFIKSRIARYNDEIMSWSQKANMAGETHYEAAEFIEGPPHEPRYVPEGAVKRSALNQ